jgi:hypothetical protein
MLPKPSAQYQGNDWFTQRWSVAQAFDSLDRMREVCLFNNDGDDRRLMEARHEMLAVMAELIDDLTGELALAEADLQPVLEAQMPALWTFFEMHLSLDMIRRLTSPMTLSMPETSDLFDHLLQLVTQIKDGLKKVDV